jgi:predicted RNA-binding protein (virulence factor B family)
MTLVAGTVVLLEVAREVNPYGFFLHADDFDVLLHYSEITREIKVGMTLEVFIYFDTEDRLAATMKRPYLILGGLAKLVVADVNPRFGCFLEMGLGRQLLLPIRELPEMNELHPQVGDSVFVTMEHDKQGRLLAKLAGEHELSPLTFIAPSTWNNQWATATVYRPLQMGTFVIVDGGVVGFGMIGLIHSSERLRMLRLGEEVQVRITHIREDGRVNLSMVPSKEVGRDLDAETILNYLKERDGGAMPYSDATPPEIIKDKFNISKSAFKRALGKLLKEGLITQKENWTYLANPEPIADESEPS